VSEAERRDHTQGLEILRREIFPPCLQCLIRKLLGMFLVAARCRATIRVTLLSATSFGGQSLSFANIRATSSGRIGSGPEK
jgi:hypothetical protein